MRNAMKILRNEVFVRIGDDTLMWIDSQRGEEARSTYIRRIIEQHAKRDVLQKGEDDGPQAA